MGGPAESKFEKLFNHWTFLFLNLVVVILVEATGRLFMDTGLIHLIAIFFIGLGIGRIFVHYEVYDQFLKPLIYGGIAILILFAVSHVLEYAGYTFFYLPFETIAANVVNFYLTGLLIIAFSVSYFLKRLEKGLVVYGCILPIGMVVTPIATIIFYLNPSFVNLSHSSWLMYLYSVAVIGVTALGISWLIRLKRHVSILVNFIDYFNAAFVMIAISSMFYVLNEPLERVGVEYMQVMYISHFVFYGALSLIFLSFVRLSHLGGMYEVVEDKNQPQVSTFSQINTRNRE